MLPTCACCFFPSGVGCASPARSMTSAQDIEAIPPVMQRSWIQNLSIFIVSFTGHLLRIRGVHANFAGNVVVLPQMLFQKRQGTLRLLPSFDRQPSPPSTVRLIPW